jgi:uncharacterized membrane protein YhaH (DUF805 family)
MRFGEAVATCFRKYGVFRGRARRPEFWFWVMFEFLALAAAIIADQVAFGVTPSVIYLFVWLALLPAAVAAAVRRFHDIDRSGWLLLVGLAPFVGELLLIVAASLPGTEGPNRFGPESR